jgi:hypothetical protein
MIRAPSPTYTGIKVVYRIVDLIMWVGFLVIPGTCSRVIILGFFIYREMDFKGFYLVPVFNPPL